jgi:molybdate transport system substrate-binding protein
MLPFACHVTAVRLPMRIPAILFALLLAACARGGELHVLAAASLTDAIREVARNWETQGGDRVVLSLAGSSTLARQIVEGAPADVFVSADEAKMDDLERRGLILAGTRRSILANTLVIVAAEGAPLNDAGDLMSASVGRIAVADPRAVPAGIYARSFLQKQGLWSKVAGKVVPTENVRAALAAVEAGNADAAIVYRTDALVSRRVRIVFEVPRSAGPDISYPFAVVKASSRPTAARKFLDYLDSKAGREVFARHGFLLR